MSLQHYILVLLACACLTEARGFRPRPELNSDDLNLLLNNPNSKTSIIDLILKSRGTTIEQLHDKLAGADGNLEAVIGGLNSELRGNLARIDGDSIRLNPDELKTLLKDGIQEAIRSKFSSNPLALSILEENIDQQFSLPSEKFDALIASKTIPLETLSKFLETHNINRQRRSLQPRDFDLGQVVSDLVLSLVRDQFTSIIYTVLENVKNVLIDLRTSTSPNGTVDNVVGYAFNSLVNGGIQLIAEIQENIRPTVNTTQSSASRKRRQAGDGSDTNSDTEVTTAGSDDTDVDNGGGGGGGGLSVILQPILNLLLLLLTPVKLLVQLLANGLVAILRPLLGDPIADVISNIGNTIIDALSPI